MKPSRKRQTPPSLRMPPALQYRGGVVKSGAKKVKLSPAMASKPLRMREWLEDLMDNERCKCLSWINKEEKMFQITWCHAARQGFDTQEHADLFIQYAEFTGKKELVDESKNVYNSKLKSNFRSALHSLVDCRQIKDDTKSKGENAVKIYQFLDHSHPDYIRKKALKTNSQRNSKKSGKCKSKCHAEPEVKEEIPASPLDHTQCDYIASPATDVFLLPDEAEEFIANNNNSSSSSDDDTNVDNSQYTITYIQPGPLIPTLPSPSPASSSSVNAASNLNIATVSQIFNTIPEEDPEDVSSLPRFSVLGVEDTFDTPISYANQLLNSGGSMKVRKQKQTYTELQNVELPSIQRSIEFEPAEQELRYTDLVTNDPLWPQGTSEFQTANLTTNVQTEEHSFHPQIAFVTDADISESEYRMLHENVTVVMNEPTTILQDENYDLYDVGKFK